MSIFSTLKEKISGPRYEELEKENEYVEIAKQRIVDLFTGTLRYRQLGKPVHQPSGREKVAQIPLDWIKKEQGA